MQTRSHLPPHFWETGWQACEGPIEKGSGSSLAVNAHRCFPSFFSHTHAVYCWNFNWQEWSEIFVERRFQPWESCDWQLCLFVQELDLGGIGVFADISGLIFDSQPRCRYTSANAKEWCISQDDWWETWSYPISQCSYNWTAQLGVNYALLTPTMQWGETTMLQTSARIYFLFWIW